MSAVERAYVGIDPGETGAVAVIFAPHYLYNVFDYGSGDDLKLLRELAGEQWHRPVKVLIERVHSTPQMGSASGFKFGANFGKWCGRMEALGIPYDMVTPKKWQTRAFAAIPKEYKRNRKSMKHPKTGKVVTRQKKAMDTKAMSLKKARMLFPQMEGMLRWQKNHNRADALLIAEHCYSTYEEIEPWMR